jgi:transcriptional regulator with GAF, ATPase, and Fis domain
MWMGPGDNLHEAMAAAARDMQDSDDIQTLLEMAVDLAVRDVTDAEAASVTVAHRHGVASTSASSHASARHADELQYAAGEGPCLSAVWDHPLIRVDDIASESRWPAWVAHMEAESGYRSMLVLRLFTAQDRLGALNLYAGRPGAFDQADVDYGEAFAAHIAVALRSAIEISGLNIALDGRTVVGQAQGLLMERFGLDAAGAFATLTRVSSHTNRKLRDIAQELVDTRQLPGLPDGVRPPEADA